jgi:hypothetical protein
MKTPQAEHRFVSLSRHDVLQDIDLAALFGETLWTLSLAKTSARLPEGLSVDDCGCWKSWCAAFLPCNARGMDRACA